MRVITAMTECKMPLYGIRLSLSASPISSTVFQNAEKLSYANGVSAGKLLLMKELLLSESFFTLPQAILHGGGKS